MMGHGGLWPSLVRSSLHEGNFTHGYNTCFRNGLAWLGFIISRKAAQPQLGSRKGVKPCLHNNIGNPYREGSPLAARAGRESLTSDRCTEAQWRVQRNSRNPAPGRYLVLRESGDIHSRCPACMWLFVPTTSYILAIKRRSRIRALNQCTCCFPIPSPGLFHEPYALSIRLTLSRLSDYYSTRTFFPFLPESALNRSIHISSGSTYR